MVVEKLRSPLELTNSGGLTVFFLGTGSAFAKRNFQTNALFIKGQGHVLVDCGTTCSRAFVSYGSDLGGVKNFLITHSHADHIGGLEEAALLGRYVTKEKPRMAITGGYKRILWNASLKGGLAYSGRPGKKLAFEDYFIQVKPKRQKGPGVPLYRCGLGGMDIRIFRTPHVPSGGLRDAFYSVGALVDSRILFTGDTRFAPGLILRLLGRFPSMEYIFHDCQLFPGGVHASYEELKTLPEEVRRKMFLCHYGDGFDSFEPEKDGFLGFAKQGYYYHFDSP